ncbi:MAG: (2Fe-2S) ferredoxin domain-containing protein [Chloroflexi bacterium]|nr:(2Fe-2S) ferredoxin domain-containing protein [Chloroflexota bacterium]
MTRRIVLCMGAYCNHGGDAEPLHDIMVEALGQPCPAFMARGDHWEIANCLSMCGAGPNLVIYPEDRAINGLTPESLRAALNDLHG